ncbi:hypothetical protein ACFQWB_11840 [Paenibacillus thermoaerophilus]|uniref:Uncharacterized protein n=1 Tax=Paenibacillus thermoaerophilus TaxID=1215385 RepID=A0ABW2V6E9_9BACL|nr:hypothetical protein [Paenibacillus thermoaerophilus]TMV17706.1 hypothetical protein FE781_06120 [Paenibacillus thermoaerophilus]
MRSEAARLKLELLDSLIASQRALARLLEAVADVAAHAGIGGSGELVREVRAIRRLQQAMAAEAGLVNVREVKAGAPGSVWVNPRHSGIWRPAHRGLPEDTPGITR